MINHFIKESTIDFPGNIGPVIFTAGCNFNCGFCHNALLNKVNERYDEEKLVKEIEQQTKRGWYNGICITGGEPLIYGERIERLMQRFKSIGLKVKLDTNGSNPKLLKELFVKKLVDYVAMDIKASKELYEIVIDTKILFEDLEESISFLASLGKNKFEFRTTIPIIFEQNKPRFLNEKEADKMGQWVLSLTKTKNFRWILQAFVSRSREEINDERMSLENLEEEMKETPKEHLEKLKHILEKYCDFVEIR
jgi:pyruvate formate lyase activating enzyme